MKTASFISLWFGFLGGAAAWFLHLMLAYLIAEFGCVGGWGERGWLGISTVAWLGLLLSTLMMLGALLASHIAKRNQNRAARETVPEGGPSAEGINFLASSGVISNRLFALIILVQSVPFLFYLQGC